MANCATKSCPATASTIIDGLDLCIGCAKRLRGKVIETGLRCDICTQPILYTFGTGKNGKKRTTCGRPCCVAEKNRRSCAARRAREGCPARTYADGRQTTRQRIGLPDQIGAPKPRKQHARRDDLDAIRVPRGRRKPLISERITRRGKLNPYGPEWIGRIKDNDCAMAWRTPPSMWGEW